MILLYSYFQSQNRDLTNIKADMDFDSEETTINAWDALEQELAEQRENDQIDNNPNVIAQTSNYIIEKVTENQVLSINTTNLDQAVYDWNTAINIRGSVEPWVQSIKVEFSNLASSFQNDNYTLQNFSAWDTSFEYNASPEFQVLDSWENSYLFTALTREWESITKLTLIAGSAWSNDTNEIQTENAQTEVTNNGSITDVNFPRWNFGEVIIANNTTAYYSDIKGLEIQKEANLSRVTCEATQTTKEVEVSGTGETNGETTTEVETTYNLTEYLVNKYGFVYWNTCRPFVSATSWITFNVLRLVWNEYKYEKHYLDYNNGIHGILELDSWTDITRANIATKNTEFRDTSYPITPISDQLFTSIIQENR